MLIIEGIIQLTSLVKLPLKTKNLQNNVFSKKIFLSFQVLAFYNSTSEREKRGEILIDGQCRVESIADSHSKSPLKTPGSKHHSKFQVRLIEKYSHPA